MAFIRANPYLEEIIGEYQNHLEKHGGDQAKARDALSSADNEWMDSEFLHCMTDTRYFLSNYYAIKTEEHGYQGLYPFWDSQEILHDEFRNMERLYGKVRAIINKARQMGASTYVSGEIFHKTIFTEHINTHVVAQDADQSKFIFDMYRGALDFLPWWMRPRIRYMQDGKFLDFDEPDNTMRDIRPGLKTKIYVDNGNKPTGAGRGKCQVPWTQVWTGSGPKSLEGLFQSTCNPAKGTTDVDGIGEWFVPESPVFTWAFAGKRLERKQVTKVFRQYYRGPIQKIEVANGVIIEKTPEHRILSAGAWEKTLEAGDHVDCVRELPWEGTVTPTPEFAELLAWQIAEGCESPSTTCFITQKDPVTRKRIANLVTATTGRVPINKSQEDLAGENKSGYVLIAGKEYKRFVTSQGYEWGHRSAKKKIPDFVFTWDKESIAIFMRAYFEAEASVSDKIDIISASKQVMESLRMMCAAFGISLRVRPCIKYASNTVKKVRRTYYRGYISGPSLLRFREKVGFLSERKQGKLDELANNSNGYTLQQCPRITQMFRDACVESGTPFKKIVGIARIATTGSMSLKVAHEALARMDGIVRDLPRAYPSGIHHAYKKCNQIVLGDWAERIRLELQSDLAEEKVIAVSEYDYEGYIYDLEVEDTHNYPTAGVVTHNTFKRAHLDELAFWDNPSQLTKALFPTMNASDGFYVMVSTPNGRNDAWHNLWRRAEAGKIDWHPIYIPYYRREKTYSLPIPKGQVFVRTEEEIDMCKQVFEKENYVIKDTVLNWARNKREEFIATDGDDKMFSQEYSANAEESFQSSATTAFPRPIINKLIKRTTNPRYIGEITYDFEKDQPVPKLRKVAKSDELNYPETHDRLSIWEMPVVGETYCMGVDTSLGNPGGDYSCIQILKTSALTHYMQVACWHGLMDPESLAEVVLALGWFYNEALAAVEVNNMGLVTNNALVRKYEYENIYRYKHLDKLTKWMTDLIGFLANQKTSMAIMSKLSKCLLENTIVINCKFTVDEFNDFTEDGAIGDDAHDDMVDALMIALYCGTENEYKDMREGNQKKPTDSTANIFEVKDRFGTVVATTTSQNEAQRVSKKHLGSFTERTSTATAKILLRGRERDVPADFANTDYSPVHDGDGTARRLYEDGMDPEDIDSEAIAEYEAAMEAAETSEDAWRYI